MATWEDTLNSWAKGPGTTEQDKSENAERAVKKAIAANQKLAAMDVSVAHVSLIVVLIMLDLRCGECAVPHSRNDRS